MAEVTVHNMPSVFVMETEMPISMVNDLNDYLDEYKEDEKSSGYSVNTTGLVAYLTKALQEAITEIETLKAKVAALEGS